MLWCQWAAVCLCWRPAESAWIGQSSPGRGTPSVCGDCTPHSPAQRHTNTFKTLSWTDGWLCVIDAGYCALPRAASPAGSPSSWAAVWGAAEGSFCRERTSAPYWAFWSTRRLNSPSWREGPGLLCRAWTSNIPSSTLCSLHKKTSKRINLTLYFRVYLHFLFVFWLFQ